MSKNCTVCGAPLDDNTAFCPSCGATVQPAAQRPDTAKAYARPQHAAPPPKSRVPAVVIASILAALVVAGAALAVLLLTNKKDESENTAPAAQTASVPAPTSAPTAPTVPPTEAPTAAPTEAPAQKDGWVSEDGVDRYYENGVLQTDTVVGSDEEGYVYVGEDGAKDSGCCKALTVGETDWNIIEGRATRVGDEWDACLHAALTYVAQCTDSSMSREEKLRAAFEYIKRDDVFLEGVLHDPPYNELDWPVVCANDLFVEGMGDCFSYGAAFAFIGKAVGYENCYACNSGGHGWAEIEGKAYDPEWDMHHQEYNHFGVSPEDDCDVAYFTTLTEGVDWMYVRV